MKTLRKNRLTYLDLAAGLMTLWVMYFHTPIHHVHVLYFFMPWFFYKSGQMFSVKTMSEEWHKGCLKLVKPYIVWSLIGYAAYILWGCCSWGLTLRQMFYTPLHSLFFTCCIPFNNALWFLPILFLVRLIGNYLLSVMDLKCFAVCFVLLILISFFRSQYIPAWISYTLWGLFFFLSGYALRKYEDVMDKEKELRKYKKRMEDALKEGEAAYYKEFEKVGITPTPRDKALLEISQTWLRRFMKTYRKVQ